MKSSIIASFLIALVCVKAAQEIVRFEPIGSVYDDPLVTSLKVWADGLKEQNVRYSSKIGVGQFESRAPDGGKVVVRGLMALDDIEPGEEIVSVPLKWVINSGDMIEKSKWRDIFEKNDHWEQYHRFALFILLTSDADQDKFRPYMEVIRKAPLQAMSVYWNDEDLSKHNPHMQKITRDRLNLLHMQYEDMFPRLFTEYPDFFTNRDNFSWEKYLWASTVIISRTFEFPVEDKSDDEVIMLIPFADLMNHRQSPLEPDVDVDFNRKANAAQVIAKRYISKGAPISCNYGPECREEFLLYHGFFHPHMASCEPVVDSLWQLQRRLDTIESELKTLRGHKAEKKEL